MKKLIYVVLVFITMVAFSSCNKVENPISEQTAPMKTEAQTPSTQTDGANTIFHLHMTVIEYRKNSVGWVADEYFNTVGYNSGDWVEFVTTNMGKSYAVNYYLEWENGTSSYDVAVYKVGVFTGYLYSGSGSGSRSGTSVLYLNPETQYSLQMLTAVFDNQDKK